MNVLTCMHVMYAGTPSEAAAEELVQNLRSDAERVDHDQISCQRNREVIGGLTAGIIEQQANGLSRFPAVSEKENLVWFGLAWLV